MALYQSKGRISELSEVLSGKSRSGYDWQRMTLVLEIPGFQGSVYKQAFQVSGDEVNDVLAFNVGDRVEVSFSIYAREWNGKWYNTIELVRIKPQETTGEEAAAAAAKPAPVIQSKLFDKPEESEENPDNDLPF